MNSSDACASRFRAELRAQPVLDRLDVVVGLGLDVLMLLASRSEKSFSSAAKPFAVAGENGFSSLRRARRERLEPFQLDAHAVADEAPAR
jgi:hypothetical protein